MQLYLLTAQSVVQDIPYSQLLEVQPSVLQLQTLSLDAIFMINYQQEVETIYVRLVEIAPADTQKSQL